MNYGTALVTYVTPVYNGASYLEALIQSVLAQDYPKTEHIIIDDGSTDDGKTATVLQRHAHLRWWSRPNQGQYATMNEGLAAARGDIICFISADDVVCPNAAKRAVEYLMDHPDVDGVYGGMTFIDQNGNDLPIGHPLRWAPTCCYPYSTHIAHCSFYLRTESLLRRGLYFDPELHFVGDYEWILRLRRSELRIGRIGKPLAKLRRHSAQSSNQNYSAMDVEIRKVQKRYGISPTLYRGSMKLYGILYWCEELVWAIRMRRFARFSHLVNDRIKHNYHKGDGNF